MIWRGKPITKGRPRLGRRRKAYTPEATVQFEASIRQAWTEQHGTVPLEGPVGMEIEIGSTHIHVDVFELEENHRPKYVSGDIDNYVKAISDGLNGAAYKDDKQVHYVVVWFTREDSDDAVEWWENHQSRGDSSNPRP